MTRFDVGTVAEGGVRTYRTFFIFKQFSAKIMPNNSLVSPGVGAPSDKSWILHCGRSRLDKCRYLWCFILGLCRWCGRNNRGKISTHVQFGPKLDMREYSSVRACAETTGSTVYRLTAVVMHHGKGFGSGHYTAYCLNKEAGKCSCITKNSPS